MSKFMGVPVTDAGEGKFKVSKSDQETILNDLGVTKEVRKVVQAAENKMAEEAAKFTGEKVLKTKIPTTLEIGTGASKVVYSMGTESIARNPKTGEESVSYGRFSIRKRGVVPSALKSGALVSIQKDIEKAFSKK